MTQKRHGLDIVKWRPDFTKSWKENQEAYKKAYFEAYGEPFPEDPDIEHDKHDKDIGKRPQP